MAIKDDRIFDKFARFEGDTEWGDLSDSFRSTPPKPKAAKPATALPIEAYYKEGGGGDAAALRRGSAARTAPTTGGTTAGGSGTIVEGGGTTAGGGVKTTEGGDLFDRCVGAGGKWIDGEARCDMREVECKATGGTWSWETEKCTMSTDDDTIPVTAEGCAAIGGTWDGTTCTPPAETDPSTPDKDIPYEKPERYKWKDAPDIDPRAASPTARSETRELEKRRTESKPVAESAKALLLGETAGIGDRYESMARADQDRKFREAQTKIVQDFARSGMSFSAPQLDAETDLVREAAMQRLITADEAENMRLQLRMNAIKTASPLEILADSGKLASAALKGTFTPGEISRDEFGLDEGIWEETKTTKVIKGPKSAVTCSAEGGVWDEEKGKCFVKGYGGPPGFSGLPTAIELKDRYPGKDEMTDVHVDRDGKKCKVSDKKDRFGRCPHNPNYGKPVDDLSGAM